MERASNTLQRIMAEALRRVPAEQLPEAAWEVCAGRAVAEKTRVLGCEKSCEKSSAPSGNKVGDANSDSSGERVTLLVEVPDANWRAQLYSMVPQLLARLNQFIKVSRIEFRLARPQDERRGT